MSQHFLLKFFLLILTSRHLQPCRSLNSHNLDRNTDMVSRKQNGGCRNQGHSTLVADTRTVSSYCPLILLLSLSTVQFCNSQLLLQIINHVQVDHRTKKCL